MRFRAVRHSATTAAAVAAFAASSAGHAKTWQIDELPYVRDDMRYEYQLPAELKGRSCASHRYEKHQYARTCLVLDADGFLQVSTRFENGKTIDGDHMYAIVEFCDADGEPVAVVTQRSGLDPGDKKWKDSQGTVPSHVLDQIASVTIEYGHFDKVSDVILWKGVAAALSAAGGNWARIGQVYVWGRQAGLIR